MKKYIHSFAVWENFNFLKKSATSNSEGKQMTVDEFFTWYIGTEDWVEEFDSILDTLQINDEWLTDNEVIAYLQKFKTNRDREIVVHEDRDEYEDRLYFFLDDDEISVGSMGGLDDDEDYNVTFYETSVVTDLLDALKGDPVMDYATTVDVIDFVQHMARDKGVDQKGLTPIAFKNWINMQRYGTN